MVSSPVPIIAGSDCCIADDDGGGLGVEQARTQDGRRTGATAQVSLPHLYLLRLGYLVMAIGLAATKWPLMEGVETCMLVALSLLSFLGLRYPIKMLPILLFEIGWKLIWLTVIALPLLSTGNMDPATLNVFYACLWVVIVLAVIPWRYVVRQYVIKRGDPWRSETAPEPPPSEISLTISIAIAI
jgi:hypothetical protein